MLLALDLYLHFGPVSRPGRFRWTRGPSPRAAVNLAALAVEIPQRKGTVGCKRWRQWQHKTLVELRGPALSWGHSTVLFFSKLGIWAILTALSFWLMAIHVQHPITEKHLFRLTVRGSLAEVCCRSTWQKPGAAALSWSLAWWRPSVKSVCFAFLMDETIGTFFFVAELCGTCCWKELSTVAVQELKISFSVLWAIARRNVEGEWVCEDKGQSLV